MAYRHMYVILVCAFVHSLQCSGGPALHVTTDFQSSQQKITEDSYRTLTFNYTASSDLSSLNNSVFLTICCITEDSDIAESHISQAENSIDLKAQNEGNFDIRVKGLFVGRTVTYVYFIFTQSQSAGSCDVEEIQSEQDVQSFNISNLYPVNQTRRVFGASYSVVVVREKRAVDVAFNVIVVLLVLIVNLGMGCKTELPVIKATLRRPVGPVTGVCSQFIIMPLISFTAAYTFSFEPALAIGFFALGCSPGGSASNAYTLFLGGMIPLWLFTLGRKLYSDSSIQVPYQNIIFSLLGLIIPVCIGLVVQHRRPAWAKVLVKVSKGIMVVFLLFVLTVGVYANVYIFRLMKAQVLVTAALLPYLGFLLGGLVALAFHMSREHIITIAVETGIQNTGIAIVLLLLSLEPPDSDISIVAPIASALFTPIPIWVAIAVRYIHKWRHSKKKPIPMDDLDNNEHEALQEVGKRDGDA
ncbi:hypothetical protein BaRGS_00033896 [Batillaria attramentaria]|uniref:Ileal sodium/bile acid cotransporter n=1 Tax=Batillaria attramentaria TaxID=370345 RepID=A0ABD0JJ04_9CAEN